MDTIMAFLQRIFNWFRNTTLSALFFGIAGLWLIVFSNMAWLGWAFAGAFVTRNWDIITRFLENHGIIKPKNPKPENEEDEE